VKHLDSARAEDKKRTAPGARTSHPAVTSITDTRSLLRHKVAAKTRLTEA